MSKELRKVMEMLIKWKNCIYTANVYRELQGLYREIRVQGFQIYGDCMYTRNPCNFEIPHSYFHCNICREFDFTGILWGFPALNVGKPCNKLIFGDILQGFPVNFKLITCKVFIFFHCNISHSALCNVYPVGLDRTKR